MLPKVGSVHGSRKVIVLICPGRSSIVVTSAMTSRKVTTYHPKDRCIPLKRLGGLLIRVYRQREKWGSLLLWGMTKIWIRVLQSRRLFRFLGPPLRFFRHKDDGNSRGVRMVRVFIINGSLLRGVSKTSNEVRVIVVDINVKHVLWFKAISASLLARALLGLIL